MRRDQKFYLTAAAQDQNFILSLRHAAASEFYPPRKRLKFYAITRAENFTAVAKIKILSLQ